MRQGAGFAWIAAVLCFLAVGCRGPVEDTPAPTASSLGCASCHDPRTEGTGGLHGAMPCDSCHGGDPGATTVHAAHRGMELEPGALDRVGETCGQAGCHAREAERTLGSPMATARGLVSVDRWVFGESAAPDGDQTLGQVLAATDPSPAEDHVRRLCAGCHLGTRRDNRDDAIAGTGSGCGACHVGTTAAAGSHPAIDALPGNDRCFGCHSRSGRISLSYQGLAEVSGEQATGCAEPSQLVDGRTVCRVEADLHHEAGLDCVDCHLHTELMGDGVAYPHQEQAVETSCEACHGPAKGATESTWASVEDPVTTAILRLRGQSRPPTERVRLGRRGTPLWTLRPGEAQGTWTLQPKRGGEVKAVPQTPADRSHALPGHERLTCSACHATWAPSCPDCHTRFDPEGEQWDFGVGAVRPGAWVEEPASVGWAPPALAVTAEDRVVPAAPGMILRVDPGGPPIERRLFARSAPHTTRRAGRACASCHRSPGALGLGSGSLEITENQGRLAATFAPAHPDPSGLARDGWVPLGPKQAGVGTRVGLRSLDGEEQRKVLQVGACLPCHDPAKDGIWADFGAALQKRRAGRAGCPD